LSHILTFDLDLRLAVLSDCVS